MKTIQESATSAYTQPRRIECLDSIRGLAAFAVLLGHTLGGFAWPNKLWVWTGFPIVNILFDGRSAVTMFFVLSGFVLAHPYLAPSEDGHMPRHLFIPTFYIRRITRIWIPWFFAFVLSILARTYFFTNYATIPPASTWVEGFWHVPLTAISIVRQCAFSLHDSTQLLLPQDWSLGVELKGSALIPLFLFLARKYISGLVAAAVLLLIFVPTGHYYVSFALGVFAAKHYWRAASPLRSLSLTSKCGVLAVGVILYESRIAANHFWGVGGVVEKVVWCVASVGCVFILAGSLSSRRIQSKLNLPIFMLLGRISYSVYLLQFIVILCLLPPFVQALNSAGIRSTSLLFPLTMSAGVVVTVALAAAMYHTIETSSIEFGRRLTRAIQAYFFKTPNTKRNVVNP
jgi:peptidoglycan/LPS O-acetylase OafA/YrhL